MAVIGWKLLPGISRAVRDAASFLTFLFERDSTFLLAKEFRQLCSAGVPSPAGWCSLPENIFHSGIGATLEQQPNHGFMARQGCLMKRRGMGMRSDWVVAIWIFAGIQQQTNDLDVAKLRGEG